MMKKILLSLILLSFVFAQSQISSAIDSLRSNMSLVTLIILFTFIFSAFVYAFGKILNMGSVKAWAKDQIYESFLSLFIGLIAIFILENFFLKQDFNALLSSSGLLPKECSNQNDLFLIDECELEFFFNKISDLLWNIFSVDILFNALSNCALGGSINLFDIFKVKLGLPLFSSLLTDLSDAISTIYYVLLMAFILNSFQVYLLYAAPYIFLLFFPAGVVLRSFGLTRKVGGSLIAISIGFSLLFPILIAIGYGYILSSYSFNLLPPSSLFVTLISGFAANLASLANLQPLALVLFAVSLIPSLSSLLSLIVMPLFFGNFNLIAPIVLGLLIVPYIIFDVLENFIRSFSSIIGQEVSVIGWVGKLL
jgi:hypothetical protein